MKISSQIDIEKLEATIGINFTDKETLALAFVHKSFVNEHPEQLYYNERLEFLGDAVLELSVTAFLYHGYPTQPEGKLTNWRSALVKGKNLAKTAAEVGIGEFLLLSRGEDMSGGRNKDYILANTMEALIGAIYLDKGYDSADKFIQKYITVSLEEIIRKGLDIDAKSNVQEIAQEKLGLTPKYESIAESGPDHNKTFVMGIYFGKKLAGTGQGNSKQEAEQAAAFDAIKKSSW
jgi:ribonuclease-3